MCGIGRMLVAVSGKASPRSRTHPKANTPTNSLGVIEATAAQANFQRSRRSIASAGQRLTEPACFVFVVRIRYPLRAMPLRTKKIAVAF